MADARPALEARSTLNFPMRELFSSVSSFSVSPDDQKIAVLTEDVSSGTGISERLYVEDLHGGGHHLDIYTTQVPKDKRGTTLWPMGWHAGALVLAVFPVCTFEPAGLTPSDWHVSNATNATRRTMLASETANRRSMRGLYIDDG